jgi:hypothetical protein
MVTTLKRGASKENVQAVLKAILKASKPKGIDVYRFCGKISLTKDPLAIQRELRNEWQ